MEPTVTISLADAQTILDSHIHGGAVALDVTGRLSDAIHDARLTGPQERDDSTGTAVAHDHTKCHSPSAADDYTGNCPRDARATSLTDPPRVIPTYVGPGRWW
jgi:hypothetical protein